MAPVSDGVSCPRCDGGGSYHWIASQGPYESSEGWASCDFCKGTGRISLEQSELERKKVQAERKGVRRAVWFWVAVCASVILTMWVGALLTGFIGGVIAGLMTALTFLVIVSSLDINEDVMRAELALYDYLDWSAHLEGVRLKLQAAELARKQRPRLLMAEISCGSTIILGVWLLWLLWDRPFALVETSVAVITALSVIGTLGFDDTGMTAKERRWFVIAMIGSGSTISLCIWPLWAFLDRTIHW
jgi:hypothetical protein